MECKHFGECGACRVYEGGYTQQLQDKLAENQHRFAKFFSRDIEVFPSTDAHYRARSEFKIWHVDDEIYYGMNHISKKGAVVLIEECPQVNSAIETLMPQLLKGIKALDLGWKLFGADFLTTHDGSDMVVSLLYHRQLGSEWEKKAKELSQILGVSIIGRARKQKLVIGKDYVTETLHIKTKAYHFHHIENSFTQPNSHVNEKMIAWAMDAFMDASGDLLELYCGAGNFTIPFATQFQKVLATEISKSSIHAAKENMRLNNIENIEFVRMSVEEFVDALKGTREYRRMKDIDITRYDLQNIFVDPPRAGMDTFTCNYVSQFENIVYISCNPETLHRDLEILTQTHRVDKMALFDQFPYTHHVEMGVKLTKKGRA